MCTYIVHQKNIQILINSNCIMKIYKVASTTQSMVNKAFSVNGSVVSFRLICWTEMKAINPVKWHYVSHFCAALKFHFSLHSRWLMAGCIALASYFKFPLESPYSLHTHGTHQWIHHLNSSQHISADQSEWMRSTTGFLAKIKANAKPFICFCPGGPVTQKLSC